MLAIKLIRFTLFLFTAFHAVLFSQNYTRRQLSGKYGHSSGGRPGISNEKYDCIMPEPPDHFYILQLKPWGRFIQKEKHVGHHVRIRHKLFVGRSKEWCVLRGRWFIKGDSLYLKHNRKWTEVFLCTYYDSYETPLWKKHVVGFSKKQISYTKIWRKWEE